MNIFETIITGIGIIAWAIMYIFMFKYMSQDTIIVYRDEDNTRRNKRK